MKHQLVMLLLLTYFAKIIYKLQFQKSSSIQTGFSGLNRFYFLLITKGSNLIE